MRSLGTPTKSRFFSCNSFKFQQFKIFFMPYYAELYGLSDAITKNSILMFGMCDLVEKLHFWRFFALKMLITPYGEIFANREISYLDCTRRDLQF